MILQHGSIHTLTETIRQLTDGNYRVRVSGPDNDPQLSELSSAINSLAEMLQQKNASVPECENKYRTLFEIMTQGVVFLSYEKNILSVNPAAEKILGGTPDSLSSLQNFYQQLHAVGNDETELPFEEIPPFVAIETGRNVYDSVIGINNLKDSSRRWLNVNAILVHENGGIKPSGVYVIFYDFTEYRLIQETLIQSAEEIQTAFESSTHGICFMSLDGRFIKTNRTMQEITGYSAEELEKKTIQEITHPDDLLTDRESIENLRYGELSSYQIQKRFIHKSGRIISVILGMSIVRDFYGHPVHFVSHFIDITTRTYALNALQKSEDALKRAQQIARLGSMEWDYIKDEVNWSDEMYRICGIEKQNASHLLLPILLENTHPADRHALEIRLELGPIIGNVDPIEFRIYHPDGKMHWIKNETHFVFNENQNPVRMNATFQDITEIKNVEKDLKNARDEAERANRTKSEFLANVSHEIRTPMNAIIGFANILEHRIEDANQLQMLKNINTSAKTLLNMLNDILDLSKVESGKLEIQSRPVHLARLLDEINQMFSLRIAEKGLTYTCNLDPAIPDLIHIDEIRLRQILLNLIGNAIKFTHRGSISLSVDRLSLNMSSKQMNVGFVVKDTGIGIAKNQIDQIFEAFRQQAGQDNKKYGGTGLGLAITKRLVELMGGEIFLETEEGSGSVFTVIFRNIGYTPQIFPNAVQQNLNQKLSRRRKDSTKQKGRQSLSPDEISGMIKLQSLLENDFMQQWESVQKTFMLNKIEKFAQGIYQLARENRFPPLLDWGQKLIDQVGDLDMEKLPDTLSQYPLMIEEIHELINGTV